MNVFARLCLSAFALLVTFTTASAEEDIRGGGAIYPVSLAGAIDVRTDAVSIYLERAVLRKENGWFTEDKEVAVTARIKINSKKRPDGSLPLTISRVYKFDIASYGDGRIEIPLKSLPLLEAYDLHGSDYYITSVVMDILLSKKRDKTGFSKTLESVIAASKKIPIPSNPYAQFASFFGDTFSDVVDKAISEGANTTPLATFGLRFIPGERDTKFTEKAGIHALVMGASSDDSKAIAIDTLDGAKLTYTDAGGLKYANRSMLNNYLIVRVVASTDPWSALASAKETYTRIASEAGPLLTATRRSGAAIAAQNLNLVLDPGAPAAVTQNPNNLEGAIRELNAIRAINPLRLGM